MISFASSVLGHFVIYIVHPSTLSALLFKMVSIAAYETAVVYKNEFYYSQL